MNTYLDDFLRKHKLPASYAETAAKYFAHLLDDIALRAKCTHPLIVGVNGTQGSGKTTLADYLVTQLTHEHGLQALSVSLDDFYFSQSKRQQLAQAVHPLLKTRGVPGTHDLDLAIDAFNKLQAKEPVAIPAFDKTQDNPFAQAQWRYVDKPVDVIVLEGWCLGVKPQLDGQLLEPINELEQQQDADGTWRSYVNEQLHAYQALFDLVNVWAMLKAPNFECVYNWRLEQEQKLVAHNQSNQIMDAAAIKEFIQYFQRLTEHALTTLPQEVDHLYILDERRNIISNTRSKAK